MVYYYTDYSIEDCIGLLSRKNIYDVFEYSFEMKTETSGEITFIRCNKHLWNNNFNPVYMIKFRRSKTTIIELVCINEGSFLSSSTVPLQWITEFMYQKLDAVDNIERKMIYYTDYSIEDCIGLLSRENIYDVFKYSFEMKTETAGEITLTGCNKHLWNGPILVYAVEFKKSKRTIIDIEFRHAGWFLPISNIPPKWITEFMKQKLDADETIEENL